MKILKIRFKNIHNLKGENEISFETEPLKSAGIFAITGPTGSGKSSLLDVITLALFNKIPRFKGSITKSTIENLGSVITHHTSEAMASITYAINDLIYTSTWTVDAITKGKNKGKPGEYSMFVYDSNGIPLTQNRSEVPAKNEEIIGLKYDQFIKSILLSQGQFAKFLKADKHERGQLLENITGTSIYRKISMAAFEKYKKVRGEVELEKDRLENIQILSVEQREELNQSILANEKEKVQLDEKLKQYQESKLIKTEIENAKLGLIEKEADLQKLSIEQSQFRNQLEQLEKYEKLSPIVGKLTQYKDAVVNRNLESSELKNHQTQLQKLSNDKHEVVIEIEKLTKQVITDDNYKKVIGAFEKEVNSIVQEMSFVARSGREIREKINVKLQSSNIDLVQKGKPDLALAELQDKLESINSDLTQSDIKPDTPIDEIEKSLEQLAKELTELNDILNLVKDQSTYKGRQEDTQKEVDRFIAEISKWEPLTKSSEQLVAQARLNLELLIKQKQDALLIAKLTDHRKDLVEGEPCPLCGATDHPFAEHVPESKDQLDSTITGTKEKLAQHEKDLLSHEKQLAKSREGKQLMEVQLNRFKEEMETVNTSLKKAENSYSGKELPPHEKLEVFTNDLEERMQTMNLAKTHLRNQKIIHELIEGYSDLQKEYQKHQALKSKKDQLYTGDNISLETNRILSQYDQLTNQISSTSVIIGRVASQIENNDKIITDITSSLSSDISSYGFSTIEEASKFALAETDVQELRHKKEALNRRETALITEKENLHKRLETNLAKDTMKDQPLSLVNENLIEISKLKDSLMREMGERTAKLKKDDEERERQKQKASTLEKLQEKLDEWSLMARLIGDASGNKFSNFAQGLTLQNLLVYANRRLLKLSDRYLLDKPLKDGPLTVVDQYQGNIPRAVTTLSGGESFLISLALALSLSDMASKNVSLESLFIDEGFGTLDQESLDIAMNTLEKLQTESQKMVGVISHVEALKERILVQIKLNKNAQGYGTIKIEG